MAILKSQNDTVTSRTDFPEFFRILHKDDAVMNIDRGNIKLAFDSLLKAAIQDDQGHQEEIRREQERQVKHQKSLEDNFFAMLKESKLTLHPDSKWIAVQDKFTNKSAFQAIKNEEDRIRLFHVYLSKVAPPSERESSGKKKSKKIKHEKSEKSPKKRPVDEDESEDLAKRTKKKKRHHRSPSLDDSIVREERKKSSDDSKKRDKERESDRKKEKERRRDRKDSGNSGGKKKGTEKAVGEKAEKLANELSEAELERQRKLLMKQLELM